MQNYKNINKKHNNALTYFWFYNKVITEVRNRVTSVLKAAEGVGCSYYVIEQKTEDPYADIEKSYKYLNSIISDIKE